MSPAPGVLVPECLVALQCGGDPGAQRGLGRALACWDRTGGVAVAGAAHPLDLVADAGLGIEPGPGDPGRRCDGGERDGHACPVEFLQFLTGWIASAPARLAASLRAYTGHPAYDLAQLRSDPDRFTFLPGGNDGEPLFQPGPLSALHPPSPRPSHYSR
jgi:hypothetical protein